MYISPIGCRFSAMNSNINRMNRVPNITEANKTDKVAFTGGKNEGATPLDLLLSEVYKEFSPEKIIAWAHRFGYPVEVHGGWKLVENGHSTVRCGRELYVKDAQGKEVRFVREDVDNPGTIREDVVTIYDESGVPELQCARFDKSGPAALYYGDCYASNDKLSAFALRWCDEWSASARRFGDEWIEYGDRKKGRWNEPMENPFPKVIEYYKNGRPTGDIERYLHGEISVPTDNFIF